MSATPATPTLLWVHADHLKRPWALTNAAQAVVWRAVYEPFGAVHAVTGPAALEMRFPGQWFQLEAGLATNWHRQDDATLGRYTQPDPLGLIDGPSVYGYAHQTPLMKVDPTGQVAVALVPPVVAAACLRFPALCAAGAAAVVNTCRPLFSVKPPFSGPPGSTVVAPKQSRRYGQDGFPEVDVDTGHDHGAGDPHAHDWSRPPGGGPPSAGNRGPGRQVGPVTPSTSRREALNQHPSRSRAWIMKRLPVFDSGGVLKIPDPHDMILTKFVFENEGELKIGFAKDSQRFNLVIQDFIGAYVSCIMAGNIVFEVNVCEWDEASKNIRDRLLSSIGEYIATNALISCSIVQITSSYGAELIALSSGSVSELRIQEEPDQVGQSPGASSSR